MVQSVDVFENVHNLQKKPKHWGWVGDLYLAGNDCGIAMRLLDGQEYEPESRKLWCSLCKDAELVVDVGAHTGVYSIDAWKAGAREVLSVEPYVVNFGRLIMNIRHAGFNSKGCVFCAAGDANKVETFFINGANYYCSTGGGMDSGDKKSLPFPVMSCRLDDLIDGKYHHAVKVVKIDTECHGAKVLAGMPRILSNKPDLILECIEPGLGDILKPLGYNFYTIMETGDAGIHRVDDLLPDDPFTFESPNRYATVKEL